jgi:general secretion pathway protein L
MSVLIVYLPTTPPGLATEYRYAPSRDGQTLLTYGGATASTLPPTGVGHDVVAVVPVRALSWHQVELPKGTLNAGAGRLRAVLEGLLEDRLLDEPQNLHFALAPQAAAGKPVWVAVCDKAWLKACLGPLEAAGRPVSRIVPEFAPLLSDDDSSPHSTTLYALGVPGEAWLVQARTSGVTLLPLSPVVATRFMAQAEPLSTSKSNSAESATAAAAAAAAAAALNTAFTPPNTVLAEPAVMEEASHLFQGLVRLQQAPERWVQTLQSPWDLAQFDLANSGSQRLLKRFRDFGLELLHGPRWRAVRWALPVLAVVNLIGLNAWAWKEKSALTQRRADVQAVLTQTFPQVKVVVDAPIQMAREVALLRQNAGATARQDLENLLTAVGSGLSPTENFTLTQLDYSEGELRLKGVGANEAKMQDLKTRLEPQGYALRMDGESLLVKIAAPTEVRP